ncbi:MAG: site-specific integrase, partial [Bacteroides sp.]|nr:site-specific integrase [Bacteroides sp.]
MAKNDVRVTDNPKLKQKILSDGNISLYLDYYLGRVEVVDEETGEKKSKVQR